MKIKILIMVVIIVSLYKNVDVHAAETPRINIVTQDDNGLTLTKDEGYVNASISVLSDDCEIENATGYVKVRGNSTAGAEKKPYKIKFSNKQDVLGMGKNKKWNLLANCFDPTLERNYIALSLAKKMKLGYTVDFQYVDLYMDSVYLGNYLLTESIDVNKNSVDINTDCGDFLLEYEVWRTEDDEQYITTSKNGYRFDLHEPENASEDQKNAIEAKLNNIEDTMINGNILDISSVIDISSFIDFYILNEYMKTIDVGASSVYFYYKDGKLYAGPAWDYDLSSGNANKDFYLSYNNNGDCDTNYQGIWVDSHWFYLLKKKPEFMKLVKYRYMELQDILKIEIPDLVDNVYISYKNSFDLNFKKWNISKLYSRLMRQPDNTYEDNLLFLKNWFINRNQWLLDYWDISEESPLIDYMNYLATYDEATNLNPEEYYNYDLTDIEELIETNPFSKPEYDTQEKVDELTNNLRTSIDALVRVGSVLHNGAPYKEASDGIAYDLTVPHIIINQVYGGKKKESYASHSFIELYNSTDEDVDLSGWSLQYRSSADGDDSTAWRKLDLTGTIPSHCSYLVRCKSINNPVEGSLAIDKFDQDWNQIINNKGCSVVLVANNKLIDADSEVFDNVGCQPVIYDYVDMVGVSGNDVDDEELIANEATPFYEKATSQIQSKKNGIRRKNLIDTDDNTVEGDFEAVDYSFGNADYIAYISPKCTTDGPWTFDETAIPYFTATYVNYILSELKGV